MKLILECPIDGYENVAEYRPLKDGDFWIDPDMRIVAGPATGNHAVLRGSRIVLTPIKPRYEPWTIDEVLTSSWYRRKDEPKKIHQITCLDFSLGIVFIPGVGWVCMNTLFEEWEYSYASQIDASWRVCGSESDIPF